MTAIQELIRFLKNDRMQNVYTGEQIIELLEFKLEKEKQQIMKTYYDGLRNINGFNLIPIYETTKKEIERFGVYYYNKISKDEI
jgi:hypothetical protein